MASLVVLFSHIVCSGFIFLSVLLPQHIPVPEILGGVGVSSAGRLRAGVQV